MPKLARDKAVAAIQAAAAELPLAAGVLGAASVVDKAIAGLKPSVSLVPAANAKPAVGGTRAGGQPDLPDGIDWPKTKGGRPMPFLLQINLAESAPFDVEGILPKTGLLSFFFYTKDEDSGEDGCVLFLPEPLTGLKRPRWPARLPDEKRYRDVPLRLGVEWTLPSRSPIGLHDFEAYWNLRSRVATAQGIEQDQGDGFQLLGHPFFIQDYEPKEDELLLQVSPAYDNEAEGCTGMGWGDGGSVYYLMSTADLKSGAFDRISLILDMC